MTILNETPETYKEFPGKYLKTMPKLRAEGRIPANVSQFMQIRLNFRNGPETIKNAWLNNYDTCDAVIYHPETQNILIDLDSEMLIKISPNPKKLYNGALLLSENRDEAFAIYEQLKKQPNVVELKNTRIKRTIDFNSKKEVKANPLWRILSRDQALLNDYTDFIYDESEKKYGCETPMSIILGSCKGTTPEMRAWYLGRLSNESYVNGADDLDDGGSHLMGILPETINNILNTRKYSLQEILDSRFYLR
ncbi:MAG TPA: hypothetical protein VJB35_00590 [Candidatus Nanoarchaeia archaeon]|nr:hypothetical protein [Candidatus Nanoarchaeia archaeon]